MCLLFIMQFCIISPTNGCPDNCICQKSMTECFLKPHCMGDIGADYTDMLHVYYSLCVTHREYLKIRDYLQTL